jgi:uncharacterized protein (TIGR00252 family)
MPNTTTVGRQAESTAAQYLAGLGYKIVATNWRTRWCEVDIIAIKNNVTYFVEVKFRANHNWGSGLDYITPTKLRQMHVAAEFWAATHKTADYRLSAIELTGQPPRVTNWIDSIE